MYIFSPEITHSLLVVPIKSVPKYPRSEAREREWEKRERITNGSVKINHPTIRKTHIDQIYADRLLLVKEITLIELPLSRGEKVIAKEEEKERDSKKPLCLSLCVCLVEKLS